MRKWKRIHQASIASTINLAFPMQWKHVIFASKVPRHLHQNLISISINVMDMKMHMLTCLSISILVGKEKDEIVIRIKYSY